MNQGLLFSILISLFSISSGAQSLPCALAQKQTLPSSQLNALTEKICSPHFGTDPDDYRQYESDIEKLTAPQRLVYEYTYYCSAQINSEMRKTSNQDLSIFKLSHQLDAALCEHPQFQGETYRGLDLPETILKQYLSSNEITFSSFTSTSKKHHIACEFAGNTVLKIHSKSGREILKQSKHESEDEVLFRLNSKFRVLFTATGFQAKMLSQCHEKPVQAYIELEEIE